jgi:hypothetical protein
MKTINYFKQLCTIVFLALNRKLLYKLQYYHQRGKFPNLIQPKDLSEYVLSEMLKPSFAIKYANYADKIKVRQYVKEMGLDDILLNHYGVWDNANKIDFNELPEKFVLKTNNGCGDHVICRNKNTLDIKKSIQQLNKTLDLPFSFNKEPHYTIIDPLIFCEELIETETGELPIDYKITCIKGNPINILVVTERKINKKLFMFDLDWHELDYIKKHHLPKSIPEKPKNLKKMIQIATILSTKFDFVRVDLYDTGDKIWFGELSFSPSGGLFRSYTDDALKRMGNLLLNPSLGKEI